MHAFYKRPFICDDRQESLASTLTDARSVARGKIANEGGYREWLKWLRTVSRCLIRRCVCTVSSVEMNYGSEQFVLCSCAHICVCVCMFPRSGWWDPRHVSAGLHTFVFGTQIAWKEFRFGLPGYSSSTSSWWTNKNHLLLYINIYRHTCIHTYTHIVYVIFIKKVSLVSDVEWIAIFLHYFSFFFCFGIIYTDLNECEIN